MGHPRALLDLVAADVRRAWPADRGFRLLFERPLGGNRAMLPDIQVVDALGKVCCAVEIGYTRPEKLTFYRASGIPDVRWYDKAGNLHGDVNQLVEIRIERTLPAAGLLFKQFDVVGRSLCRECIDAYREGACGLHLDEGGCACAAPQPLTDDQWEQVHGEALDEMCHTRLTVVSNGVRWIGLVLCDDCGDSFTLTDRNDLFGATDIYEAVDFEVAHRRGQGHKYSKLAGFIYGRGDRLLDWPTLTYDRVVEMAKTQFDLDITYDDFEEWDRPRGAHAAPIGAALPAEGCR